MVEIQENEVNCSMIDRRATWPHANFHANDPVGIALNTNNEIEWANKRAR